MRNSADNLGEDTAKASGVLLYFHDHVLGAARSRQKIFLAAPHPREGNRCRP